MNAALNCLTKTPLIKNMIEMAKAYDLRQSAAITVTNIFLQCIVVLNFSFIMRNCYCAIVNDL